MAKLIYSGPPVIKANQLFHCELTVVLEEEIAAGGVICIASRHVSDIGLAQCDNKRDDNFVEFSAQPARVKFLLSPVIGLCMFLPE